SFVRHAAALAAVCLLAPTLRGAPPSEHAFIWAEANARLATARTPEAILEAARAYSELIDLGVRNGPLYYNLGTALLRAERYADAHRALRRAERYAGSTWETRRNLRLARAGLTDDEHAALPWYRFPLFWHFGPSMAARTAAALAGFAGIWIALAVSALGRRAAGRYLLIAALALTVLFGTSTLTSLHLEAQDRLREWKADPS
ncbi:MAG: hypothetical protein JW951_08810, partial [Lentisphaerae bacterium]|nr:hypothetical protein [Lentisphaerota bacterium]